MFSGINEHGLNISLHAKLHQGEANEALLSFLAKLFDVPKTNIILKRGKGSRYKQVLMPLTKKVKIILENPNFLLEKKTRFPANA